MFDAVVSPGGLYCCQGAVPKVILMSEMQQQSARAVSGVTIFAATIGNMLEFYDFVTFSFFALQIGRTFFPSHNQYSSLMLSLATFGAGFATRPIGAFVIGRYSDRRGRKPAMMLSFIIMGIAILAFALIPSYRSIGIAAPIIVIGLRLLQGFSLGGEIGPTTAFLLEASPVRHRGLAVSWQPASQQIAATAGALVGVILSRLMDAPSLDNYGWRIAFLIGAATLPFGLWARSGLTETIDQSAAAEKLHEPDGKSRKQVRRNARLILLGLVILASGTIITYVTQYMTTYAENTLHVSPGLAFATTLISNGIGIVAALFGGWLADRVGRLPIMVWPQLVALLITYPIFVWIVETRSAPALLAGFGFLSFVGSIPYSAFYVALVEGLPQKIRGGAFGTTYAVAIATFGGTAQLIVTWLIHVTDSALAPAWYMALATAAGLVAMIFMPETRTTRIA